MEFKALLFDTRSIQRYIYSGNWLKTNIGASYLVEHLFDDVLVKEILEKEFPGEVDTKRRFTKGHVDWNEMETKCAVAYIGGGNALILFKMDTEDGIQRNIVQKFSRHLLTSHPGLHIGAAFDTLDLSSSKSFQDGIDRLYKKLKQTQATVFPPTNVPYTGLTLSCEVNGEAANYCDTGNSMGKSGKKEDGPRFFSQEVRVKTEAEKEASDELRIKFEKRFERTEAEEVFKHYTFPRVLDELGQKRDKARSNYIAIVHIDGNNMGEKFRRCEDMEARRILAMDIKNKTEGSFALLLQWIMEQCEKGAYEDDLVLKPQEKDSSSSKNKITDKKILPIRPLILGGDDVTFICPAKVALTYTKRLMEILLKAPPENWEIQSPAAFRMDSCAGIAILPTSYPFFRGYELAEQLCDAAKKRMRLMEESDTAWLDFAILHGEQAPTLEQIREREYSGMRGMMHFGPYQVGNGQAKRGKESAHNIENLIDCVRQLRNGAKDAAQNAEALPMSKIKEMRNVLQRSEDEAVRFIEQMRRLGQKLPSVADWSVYEESLWHKKETPYVDAIEMMDFIPKEV